jgi:glycosyltransferase involved in cell wall biosynthesis
MRVALVTNFYPPIQTGSSFWAKDWSVWFSRLGGELVVITGGEGRKVTVSEEDGIITYRLPATYKLPRMNFFLNFDAFYLLTSYSNIQTIKSILLDHRIDVAHQSNHLLDSIFLTGKVCKALDIPSVITVHSIISHGSNRLYNFLMQGVDRTLITRTMKRFGAVVSLEKEVQRYVDQTYAPMLSRLIPLCCVNRDLLESIPRANPGSLSSDGRLRIASVGHVTENRHRCELIRAIPTLLKNGHNPRLEIVGKILTDAPVKLTKALGVTEYVEFLGEMKREDIFRYLKGVNIEAHLLLTLGIGIASQEAMAVGLPVIAPGYEGLYGDVPLQDGVNILFAMPTDQSSVDRALLRLADSPAERRRIGENARELIGKYLTWETIIDQYKTLFEELL